MCSLVNLERGFCFEHKVQFHCNTCLFGVRSRLRALPYTTQIYASDQEEQYTHRNMDIASWLPLHPCCYHHSETMMYKYVSEKYLKGDPTVTWSKQSNFLKCGSSDMGNPLVHSSRKLGNLTNSNKRLGKVRCCLIQLLIFHHTSILKWYVVSCRSKNGYKSTCV